MKPPLFVVGLLLPLYSACTTSAASEPATVATRGSELVASGGACVDVEKGVGASGTPVVLFHCYDTPSQRWTISNRGIVHDSGGCLDVKGGVGTDGASIVILPCNGAASQLWTISDGKVIGIGGKCLDLPYGYGAEDLEPIILRTCMPIANQEWAVK